MKLLHEEREAARHHGHRLAPVAPGDQLLHLPAACAHDLFPQYVRRKGRGIQHSRIDHERAASPLLYLRLEESEFRPLGVESADKGDPFVHGIILPPIYDADLMAPLPSRLRESHFLQEAPGKSLP